MKSSELQTCTQGFLGFFGWVALGIFALALLIIWPIRSDIGDTLLDFLNIFTDGTDLGEWLVGIIVGILTGLWNFGTSIGYSWFGGP